MKCKSVTFFFLLLASCLLLLLSTSCAIFKESLESWKSLTLKHSTQEVKVYFTKSSSPEEIFLVTVKRKISKEDNIISGSLRELFLGPTKIEESKGIMTEIPIGARLINIQENDNEILINLSSQYLIGGGSASMQIRYLQLYKTLKNISPDKKFYLQVEGKEIKTIGGEGVEVTQPLTMISDYTKKYEKVDEP